MCGIVGAVLAEGSVQRSLIEGLRVLEYRGYDSAGIAVATGEGLRVARRAGRLEALEGLLLEEQLPEARAGIGHTRWATHGPPTDANAHPHQDAAGQLALVHNGIIENYLELRDELASAGVRFQSDTDSEVLAQLVGRELDGGASLVEALRAALGRVRGYYAVAVLRDGPTPELVCARQGPPLMVGLARDGTWLGSDVLAIVPHTRQVVFLEDGDVAELSAGGVVVRGLKALYRPALRGALRWRGAVVAGAAVATALAIALASSFGSSFLPEFNEGTFTVGVFAPPGTSLRASDRLAGAIEQRLLEVEGVRSVTRRTGRAERDEHAEPVSNSELEITLVPGAKKREVRREVTRILEQVPGITTNVGQPIEHRLSHILSGTPAAIAISIFGEDLGVLRRVARDIEGELRALPGARDVNANREVMITSLPIRYRHLELAAAGLTPADAALQVRAAIDGEHVTTVNDGPRQYDMVVRLAPDERRAP